MSRDLTEKRAVAAAVARLREWTNSINASDEETAAEDIATAYLAELRTVDAPPAVQGGEAAAWDTDVRLVLSEVATWITLAHHRDGCHKRHGEPCSCGRDSILAKLKFPASHVPPSGSVPAVSEETLAHYRGLNARSRHGVVNVGDEGLARIYREVLAILEAVSARQGNGR